MNEHENLLPKTNFERVSIILFLNVDFLGCCKNANENSLFYFLYFQIFSSPEFEEFKARREIKMQKVRTKKLHLLWKK
jgi:hypothetical protein